MLDGVLLAVFRDVLLLHGIRKGGDGIAGLLFAGSAVNGDRLAGDNHLAFGAGEDEAFALLASVDKIDAQAQVEVFRVVEERKQNVVDVAAVFPVADEHV